MMYLDSSFGVMMKGTKLTLSQRFQIDTLFMIC